MILTFVEQCMVIHTIPFRCFALPRIALLDLFVVVVRERKSNFVHPKPP